MYFDDIFVEAFKDLFWLKSNHFNQLKVVLLRCILLILILLLYIYATIFAETLE